MTRLCDVPGCGRKHYALGKCRRHYKAQRARRLLRRDRSNTSRALVGISLKFEPAEADVVRRAAAILNMTRTAFLRAAAVGEARQICRQKGSGIDRRALTLRRWRKLYGEAP